MSKSYAPWRVRTVWRPTNSTSPAPMSKREACSLGVIPPWLARWLELPRRRLSGDLSGSNYPLLFGTWDYRQGRRRSRRRRPNRGKYLSGYGTRFSDWEVQAGEQDRGPFWPDRKSTRLNSSHVE